MCMKPLRFTCHRTIAHRLPEDHRSSPARRGQSPVSVLRPAPRLVVPPASGTGPATPWRLEVVSNPM